MPTLGHFKKRRLGQGKASSLYGVRGLRFIGLPVGITVLLSQAWPACCACYGQLVAPAP